MKEDNSTNSDESNIDNDDQEGPDDSTGSSFDGGHRSEPASSGTPVPDNKEKKGLRAFDENHSKGEVEKKAHDESQNASAAEKVRKDKSQTFGSALDDNNKGENVNSTDGKNVRCAVPQPTRESVTKAIVGETNLEIALNVGKYSVMPLVETAAVGAAVAAVAAIEAGGVVALGAAAAAAISAPVVLVGIGVAAVKLAIDVGVEYNKQSNAANNASAIRCKQPNFK
jgi:hypothetical protein